MGVNIVPRDEENAEVPNAFCASIFNNKTSCSPGTQHPEMVARVREQNEALLNHEEMFSDLLDHLDVHTSMEPNRIH